MVSGSVVTCRFCNERLFSFLFGFSFIAGHRILPTKLVEEILKYKIVNESRTLSSSWVIPASGIKANTCASYEPFSMTSWPGCGREKMGGMNGIEAK